MAVGGVPRKPNLTNSIRTWIRKRTCILRLNSVGHKHALDVASATQYEHLFDSLQQLAYDEDYETRHFDWDDDFDFEDDELERTNCIYYLIRKVPSYVCDLHEIMARKKEQTKGQKKRDYVDVDVASNNDYISKERRLV